MAHTYTTNQIKLNVPSKVLPVNVSTIAGTERWPFQNSSTDPWWSGGPTPRDYRWRVTFSVTSINHGSNLTRDDFAFNGLDVKVNDWIASATTGKCLKIISIEAKTKSSVTCVIEDWLRYNTFKSSTGNGMFNPGAAVVFSLNEIGQPMLDPLPSSVSTDFYATVTSRFNYLNPQKNYVLEQESHGFAIGDVVSVTSTGFAKTNADTAINVVGYVTDAGPGENYFMISPNNSILDIDPAIPGKQGERIYVDDVSGTLTNVEQLAGKAVFLNLSGPTPTVLTGTVGDPEVTAGHQIILNGETVTFTAGGPAATLTEIISVIDAVSADTKVDADRVPRPTIIESDSIGTAYGLVGGYPPFSATFNGTLVNFTSSGSVYPGISTPEDMAIDINATGIANISASATETVLTITEANGNSIVIANNTPDANANPFVGTSNVSGLPATTGGLNEEFLVLSRADGGEVLIYENTEVFQTATGIFSGQNGSLPLAMTIEQGIRKAGTTVVADITERDLLAAQVGDQAYVLDAGFGEWALYLYDGTFWTQTATQDSSTVDARTITTTFTGPFSGNVNVQNIGYISPGRKVTTVSVEVLDTLVGSSNVPSIEVGTASNVDLFMGATDSDLEILDEYISLPEYIHPSTANVELLVQAKLTHFNATKGSVIVKITYL